MAGASSRPAFNDPRRVLNIAVRPTCCQVTQYRKGGVRAPHAGFVPALVHRGNVWLAEVLTGHRGYEKHDRPGGGSGWCCGRARPGLGSGARHGRLAVGAARSHLGMMVKDLY